MTNEWRDIPRNHTEEEKVSLNLKPQSFGGETDYGPKIKECFRLQSQRFLRSFFIFSATWFRIQTSHVDKRAKAFTLKLK